MFWVHFFITLYLFNLSHGVGVFYVICVVIYYVNKSTKNKQSHKQHNSPNTTQVFRTQPTTNHIGTDVIDINAKSSNIARPNGYEPNIFFTQDDVIRRLMISGEDRSFVQRLWSRRTNFTAISQCADETMKLYLHIIHDLKVYKSYLGYSDSTKGFFNKLFTERTPTFFDSNFYSSGTQSFVNDVYKLCENTMRKNYRHNRKLDETYYTKGILKLVDRVAVELITNKLSSYTPAQPNKITREMLVKLTPSGWKEEMKSIKNEIKLHGYNEIIKNNINELIEANEKNAQFPELCFEVCKQLADHDKVEALTYYMLYKTRKLAKGQITEKLPGVIIKTIFKGDDKKNNELNNLSLNLSLSELRLKIKDIFTEKRKEIIINPEIVEQKREMDRLMTTEINKILSTDDDSLPINKFSSINDVFNNAQTQVDTLTFSDLHKKFIQQFISQNYKLRREYIDDFSQQNHIFPTILINEINELFYEVYEDILILEEDNVYTISESYRSKIQI